MTTAMLSVGIDTKEAFASLVTLRAEMRNQPHNLLISVDPASVDRDIQRYLKQRTFKISVNTKALGAEIANDVGIALDRAFTKTGDRKLAWNQAALRGGMTAAIDAVFNDKERRLRYDRERLVADLRTSVEGALSITHHINIDKAALALQVREAVAAGLVGGVVKVSGVAGAAGAQGAAQAISPASQAALVRSMREMLMPAVDGMTKAAFSIASAAKATAITRQAGSPSASTAQSNKNPDGSTTKFSIPIPQDKVAATMAEVRAGGESKQKDALDLLNQTGARQLAFQRRKAEERELDDLIRANQSGQALNEVGNRASQMSQRRAELRELNQLIKANESGKLLNETGSRQIAVQRRKAEERELDDLIRANQSGQALNEAGSRAAQMTQRRAELRELNQLIKANESGKALNESGGRASDFAKARAQARGESFQALEERKIAVKAMADAEFRAEQDAVGGRAQQYAARKLARQDELNEARRHYQALKLVASEQYAPTGASIIAARGLLASSPSIAREALGPGKTHFLDASLDAERYRKVVAETTSAVHANKDAHRVLTTTMNEAHSAARGLAGSMGAMWATYGSVVPLVAAAALGASIRQVVMVGKDLEYQLTFVSALTDNAVVSTQRLSQAIAGSVVGPVKAAEAMRGLAQNGLDVNEAFMALPAILALATAGEMTLSEAALGATGVMAAFNKNVSDLGLISDVFAKAAAMSNTDVKGMVEAMKQASTVGDQFGITVEEAAASLATMAKRNIAGTAAGTAFRNMMKEMATPTKQAKAAIDDLGLKFFDTSGKLKPLQENLASLQARLSSLDEESKLSFIDRIFGERGGKAANAILSDLDAFGQTFDTLKNKAKGFSKEVADALAQTTDGRIKVLFSEFQTAAANAFDGASGGINNFIESLRGIVNSSGFKEGLASIVSGVTRLTTFLIEHADTVKTLLMIWGTAKVLTVAGTLLYGIGSAAVVAASGVTTLAVAAKGLFASLTLGLSLVVALGVEFLLLSRSTDQATEADRAHSAEIANGNVTLENRLGKLTTEVDLLARKNLLMRQGKTDAEANAQLASEGKKAASTSIDNEIKSAQGRAFDAKVAEQSARSDVQDSNYSGDEFTAITVARRASLAKDELKRANDDLENLQIKKRLTDKIGAKEELSALYVSQDNRLNAIRSFNKDVAQAKTNGVKVGDLQLPETFTDSRITDDRFTNAVAEAKAQLNALKEKRELPTTGGSNSARSEDKADIRDAIQGIHDEEAALKQYSKFRKELDAAKYNPNLFGQQIGAYLAEQRAIELTTKELNLQSDAVAKLKALKSRPNLTTADRKGIDTDIKREEAKLLRERDLLKQQKEIADANTAERARQEDFDDKKLLKGHDLDDRKSLDKTVNGFSIKTMDAASAAQATAELEVQQRYVGDIQKYLEKTEETQSAIATLRARQSLLSEADAARESGVIGVLETNLALQESRLAVLKAQASSAASIAGNVAKIEQQKSETAAFGWDKFWVDYVKSAETAATQVESIMKKTTNGLTQSLGNFISTGKFGFKDLAQSILKDLNQLMATNLMKEFYRAIGIGPGSEGAGGLGGIIKGLLGSLGGGGASSAADSAQSSFRSAELLAQKATEAASSTALAASTALQTAAATSSVAAITAMATAATSAALALSEVSGGGASSGLSSIIELFTKGGGDFGGAGSGGDAFAGFAHGGVMTPYGPMALRRYAAGGVAHGPQVSVHGEGSLPEANVPLQDGRTIPVTLKGGATAGGSRPVTLNVINNGAPVQAKTTQRETDEGTMIELVLDAVAADVNGGGRVHDSFQRRFQLNPGGSTPRN